MDSVVEGKMKSKYQKVGDKPAWWLNQIFPNLRPIAFCCPGIAEQIMHQTHYGGIGKQQISFYMTRLMLQAE